MEKHQILTSLEVASSFAQIPHLSVPFAPFAPFCPFFRPSTLLSVTADPTTVAYAVVCLHIGEGHINSNYLYLVDPRPTARMAISLAVQHGTQMLELRPGSVVLLPSYVEVYNLF